MDGEAGALAENEDVKEFYLGIAEGRRKSFREGKHYGGASGGWRRRCCAIHASSWPGLSRPSTS